MKVDIKLIEDGKIPVLGEPNAMCHDCYCRKIEVLDNGKVKCFLGFAAKPPKNHGIRLIPRSNLTKYWWVLNNSIGVGDPDYKEEYVAIFSPLLHTKEKQWDGFSQKDKELAYESFPYQVGDRVCQMEIYNKVSFTFKKVEKLEGVSRGLGFGSTGLK